MTSKTAPLVYTKGESPNDIRRHSYILEECAAVSVEGNAIFGLESSSFLMRVLRVSP